MTGWRGAARACIAIGLALVIAACASVLPGRQPAPAEVRVATAPFLALAPLAVADEEGYFAEQRLTIKPVTFQRFQDALPALAAGTLDVLTPGASVGVFNALARDSHVRVVAGTSYLTPGACTTTALVARRELVETGALASAANLRRKRVSLTRGNFEEYWIERVLAEGGLTLDDLQLVDLQPAEELQGLRQGTLDLVSATEPWITQIVRDGHGVVWATAEQQVPEFQLVYLLYGPTLYEQRPDVGERFLTAYLKGMRKFAEGKTPRNLEIAARFTQLDRGLLDQMCWPAFRGDAHPSVESALDFQAWAVRKGLLDAPVGAEQLWDRRFADAANGALGSTTP